MTGDELFTNSVLIVILFFLVRYGVKDEQRRLRREEEEKRREEQRRLAIQNSDYRWGGDPNSYAIDEGMMTADDAEFERSMQEGFNSGQVSSGYNNESFGGGSIGNYSRRRGRRRGRR